MSREFNTGEPLAYFLTWTTYGTWLPGDQRGWNRKDAGGLQEPDYAKRSRSQQLMMEREFRLDSRGRLIVEKTIEEHCKIRGWMLHRVNPRSNHVHVVVTAPGYGPKVVMEQFKAWCTRRLKESGIERDTFWTEGGSRRFVNSTAELERVIIYATEGQDRKNLDEE